MSAYFETIYYSRDPSGQLRRHAYVTKALTPMHQRIRESKKFVAAQTSKMAPFDPLGGFPMVFVEPIAKTVNFEAIRKESGEQSRARQRARSLAKKAIA